MRTSLLWKLLAVQVSIIVVVIAVVWAAVDYLAADYFSALMSEYDISPTTTHQMFVDAVHRYLIQATLGALALAALLSFVLTRRLLRPLAEMAVVTRRIAAGDYSARVHARGRDEVGQLGAAFNRMADSLEEVDRLRKTMVADIAHELRTPLSNVRGYLEGLSDRVVPPSKETYELLQQEVLRLVRLVDDLQQLTKADAARANLRPQAVSLSELLQQVLDFDGYRIRGKQIAVETDVAEPADRLKADPDALLQVLRNLVENAWQYAEPGGRLRVAAAREDSEVRLEIANTGPAIAEDDLPYIFERFYRADKSRSRASGGAGIGLAIVKELVEAHGGSVAAASEDGWTRVWLRLPAAGPAAEKPRP